MAMRQIGWFLSFDGGFPALHAMDTRLPTSRNWTVQAAYVNDDDPDPRERDSKESADG